MTGKPKFGMCLAVLVLIAVAGCGKEEGNNAAGTQAQVWPRDGSVERQLQVMLIPADGGTEEGTIADFQPVFNAVSRTYGLNFNMRVGQSYGAVVEAMANGQIDIAFFGPVSYVQTRERGAAELLGVTQTGGSSVYFAGIFVPANSPAKSLADLKDKRIAVGDSNSASSFTFPLAMLMDAGVDPVQDLAAIYITGSHVNSLIAVVEGRADAGCASFDSLQRAVNAGQIAPDALRPLERSQPIPNPPLAMHTGLPAELKQKLKEAFGSVHQAEGVNPEMIRGYGGSRVDSYDTNYSEEEFMKAAAMLQKIEVIKGEILAKAGRN